MIFCFPACHFVLYKLHIDVCFFAGHCVLKCFIMSIFSPMYSKMPAMLYKTSQGAQNDM
jgi:hypothetical protein